MRPSYLPIWVGAEEIGVGTLKKKRASRVTKSVAPCPTEVLYLPLVTRKNLSASKRAKCQC